MSRTKKKWIAAAITVAFLAAMVCASQLAGDRPGGQELVAVAGTAIGMPMVWVLAYWVGPPASWYR